MYYLYILRIFDRFLKVKQNKPDVGHLVVLARKSN